MRFFTLPQPPPIILHFLSPNLTTEIQPWACDTSSTVYFSFDDDYKPIYIQINQVIKFFSLTYIIVLLLIILMSLLITLFLLSLYVWKSLWKLKTLLANFLHFWLYHHNSVTHSVSWGKHLIEFTKQSILIWSQRQLSWLA